MKESFRQSMLQLHSWLGVTAGWLLFFVFLTGTTGFVKDEISRWMRPELPLISGTPAAQKTLAIAERYLTAHIPDAEFWSISFPGRRGYDELTVAWRAPRGEIKRAVLDFETGEAVHRQARETGGGQSLYVMHYALHYLSRDIAVVVVGVAAMMMFTSLLTGFVGYKATRRDFSALRSGRSYGSWRSRHALLGITALPFFLMMTWSGLILFLFVYMPTAQTALFPDDDARMRFNVEAYYPPGRPYGERSIAIPPSLTSLPEVLDRAEELWGRGNVAHIRVDNPGNSARRVTAHTRRADVRTETRAAFEVQTGEPILLVPPRTMTAKIQETLIALHKGHFAGSHLKALYVVGGLAGTALIGTGLVQWSMKRKQRRNMTPGACIGIAAVGRINLATVIGQPLGLAAYFWANRLLPSDMTNRSAWETHVMFIVWGAAFLYAGLRPQNRAWPEICAAAGAAYGFIPILNVLTTDRHLGVTIAAGDWVLAGFDGATLVIGAFFGVMACSMRDTQRVGQHYAGDAMALPRSAAP